MDTLNQVQNELEHEKMTHAQNLEEFDGKFDNIKQEMEVLREENSGIRDKLIETR